MSSPRVVLIVDDNPTNLKLTSRVLEHDGYRVRQAQDADAARHRLDEAAPDLILMDLQMPGTDGLTLTRELKADERSRHIPIVALTSHAMRGDDQKALEAGCDGYITKPIDTRELALQIARFLPGDPSEKESSLRNGGPES